MTDILADPRCDCRINRATGLQCRDCPKRRAALRPADAGPLTHTFRQVTGLAIPTFLRRQTDSGKRPPTLPDSCCED